MDYEPSTILDTHIEAIRRGSIMYDILNHYEKDQLYLRWELARNAESGSTLA